jgi:lipoate synthase
MLGLGEFERGVYQTMRDLRAVNVDIVWTILTTLVRKTLACKKFITPEPVSKIRKVWIGTWLPPCWLVDH